jgi:hypothetical protein
MREVRPDCDGASNDSHPWAQAIQWNQRFELVGKIKKTAVTARSL